MKVVVTRRAEEKLERAYDYGYVNFGLSAVARLQEELVEKLWFLHQAGWRDGNSGLRLPVSDIQDLMAVSSLRQELRQDDDASDLREGQPESGLRPGGHTDLCRRPGGTHPQGHNG